jgi:phosphomannomutase/phosphoglucomutase
MSTASHNPKEYNGMKLGTGYSATMVTEDILYFKSIIEKGEFSTGAGTNQTIDIFDKYLNKLTSSFSMKKKWKIVVDACNTYSGVFYPQIFRAFGFDVVEQNCTPDGTFPSGVPDPTETKVLQRLADRVLKENADIGFAYDSDGDRMAVVDNKGNMIWMDTILSLFSLDVLDYMPGASIVFNTLCSRQVYDAIEGHRGKPVLWITGHSFIKAKIKEIGAPFGGELSGHIYFPDNFFDHDDGAYASLRLLQYLERKNMSVSEAVQQLTQYVSSPEVKLGLADDIKFSFIENTIQADMKAVWPDGKYTTIDGVRIDFPDKMIIIRASQNGPYITIKFEAKTQEEYNSLKGILKEMLSKHSEIDWSKGVNVDVLGK